MSLNNYLYIKATSNDLSVREDFSRGREKAERILLRGDLSTSRLSCT